RFDRVLSGCSTNACLALNYLGEDTVLIGTVGTDFSEILKSELDNRNIGYKLYPSEQTGGFSLIYDERGDRTLDILGVAESIPVNAEIISDADFILIGPILNEIPVELVKNIRLQTKTPILTDPQGLLRFKDGDSIIHKKSQTYAAIAKLSTIVKANELEATIITGLEPREDPEKCVKLLHESGCQIAIVTLAEAGSIIFDGKDIYKIPPYTTTAIDPTGAGDTYAAGFMSQYLITPDDLTRVGCFASSVASIMVENSGPVFPLTRTEANRRTESLLQGPIALKL
ncbi:MAG: ribokinase, partial [Anaerolinea sp.]|nr:ribokinase [Anaerolinea sp.]